MAEEKPNRAAVRIPWVRLLAEFGVIFLGVTLSLLADDWRQSRSDRADERMALEELLADLEADSIKMDSLRMGVVDDAAAALWIHQRLGEAEMNRDELSANLGTIYNWYSYPAPRATYAGLRSTGRLTLIRDDDLRREVTRYYEERQPYIDGFYESNFDLWLAFRDAMALDVEWRRHDGFTRGGFEMVLRRPWREVPTDPLLRHRLDLFGVLSEVIAQRSTDVLKENSDLRESIRGVLSG